MTTRTGRDTFLPFAPPLIGEAEKAGVLEVMDSDWLTTGPRVRRFEERFRDFVGAPEALALSSGTGALHTALATLGVGAGDAVITTPMTFCSSVHVIEQVGARPVLVDVESDTLNLDPERVADVLRRGGEGDTRVRALLPVHLYGHPCDMDPLLELALEHGLHVVEDAAHALPAAYRDRRIGAVEGSGDGSGHGPGVRLACFSFYATKNLTTGEGGMLTGPPAVVDEARTWSLHGMSRGAYDRYGSGGSWYYEVLRPGFKYNMTDIQAAIGLGQLDRLPAFQDRRREIVARYDRAFRELPHLRPPSAREEVEHAWHIYAVRVVPDAFVWQGEEGPPDRVRNRFIEELRVRNIGASVHFIPVHLHPWYRDRYGFRPEDFPVAYDAFLRLVSLPLYPRMTDGDVEDVIRCVRDVVETFGA